MVILNMNEQTLLSKIPSVDVLLQQLTEAFPQIQPAYLKQMIVWHLNELRASAGKKKFLNKDKETIFNNIVSALNSQINELLNGSLKPVINATGVVLHTGLGRAPIAAAIARTMMQVSRYGSLEFDLQSGKRGQRNDHVSFLLRLLSGAEDGLAVNNNAAAVMLMLNTIGYRKEVILSRGEMIEIGGSFRMPEVMKMNGVKLREVGTTNKTHINDYEEAISAKTGGILICHTSNYEIHGFSHKPPLKDIVALSQKYTIPLIYDLGSGSFAATSRIEKVKEPEVPEIVRAGVDLISFSGDKLLGGPQAGIIVGKKAWVQKCAKNHLLRALRLDKFILKALQETLLQYLYAEGTEQRLAAHRALLASADELKARCEQFVHKLPEALWVQMRVAPGAGKVGSGAYPTVELPSYAIQIVPGKSSAAKLAAALRNNEPPVIGYIADDMLHLDLRTVDEEEEELLLKALEKNL